GTPSVPSRRARPPRPQTVAPSHHEDAAAAADVRSAFGVRRKSVDQLALEAVSVHPQLMQCGVVVLGFVQRQQEVFGTDVVVAEPKCLAERQFQYLLGLGVEWDQHWHVADPRRQRDGLVYLVGVDALTREQLRG